MTPQVLQQTLRKVIKDEKRDGRLAFGVHTESPWTGNGEIDVDGARVRVAPCRSMLEMRQALTESDRPLALVTSLPDDDNLAADIRARLYKQRLIDIDMWELVVERFGAHTVESRLRRDRTLAQRILIWLDSRQPPLVASGILSEGALWTFVLRETVEDKLDRRPDLTDVLAWRSDTAKWRALNALPSEMFTALRDWLKRTVADITDLVLGSNSDHSPLVLGTALLALRDEPSARDRIDWGLARGRLEKFFGDQPLTSDLIKKFTEAAEALLPRRNDVKTIVHAADDILEQIGATRFAVRSQWSALGSRLLLDELASRLDDHNRLLEVERSFVRTDRQTLNGLFMAARLTRWLSQSEPKFATVADAAHAWVANESWADWARSTLRNFTTDSAKLNRALARLREGAADRRDRFNLQFARLLAAETHASASLNGILGVENILHSVVAPLVQRRRVLLIVMDGMSWPILRELASDLADRRWIEFRRGDELPVAISALPSATQFSRCSLLSGALAVGGQQAEERNLRTKFPDAVLFHKNELADFPRSEAAREIGNEKRKLVALVVNAIDDLLAGSEQTTETWSLGRLSLLQAILAEAASADRVVVLTSDHGHVIEGGTVRIPQSDASDRWRTGVPQAESEVSVAGPRMLAGKSIVALASEGARYALKSHNGYHGGLTPQECIVPIVVLSQSGIGSDWTQAPSNQPAWWNANVEEAAVVPAAKGRKGQPSLFDPSRHWIDQLLQSDLFKAQIELTSGRVKPDHIEKLLRALSAAPGQRMLKQAFASEMQINAVRVSSMIAMAQRVLNIDGYPVLTLDESTGYIALHQDLLLKQFELS